MDVGQQSLVFALCGMWFTSGFLHVQCDLHLLLQFYVGISHP